MTTDIRYKLVDYDGGLEAHPVPERTGQLRLVGSWWELHFEHAEALVNGELSDYVLEALPVDRRSCLVSIREPEPDDEILCTFLLPNTSADRFMSDLDQSLGRLEAGDAENGESRDWCVEREWHAPTDFPLRMKTFVGQRLELRSTSRFWELCSGDGQRLALIDLYPVSGSLAHLVCAEGSWRLNKRRKYGWQLVIESADGRPIGSYSGRHWALGGTILLLDGVQAGLRHTPIGRWELRLPASREPIVSVRGHKLMIHSLPVQIYYQAEVVILTACAVTLLYASVPTPGSPGSGG